MISVKTNKPRRALTPRNPDVKTWMAFFFCRKLRTGQSPSRPSQKETSHPRPSAGGWRTPNPNAPKKSSHPRPSAGGWRPPQLQPQPQAACHNGALFLSPRGNLLGLRQNYPSRGQLNYPSGGEVKGTIKNRLTSNNHDGNKQKKRIVKSKICQTFGTLSL